MRALYLETTYPHTLYRWIWKLVDWIYPPVCGGCGQGGERWCENCQRNVQRISGFVCPYCGLPTSTDVICYNCRDRTWMIDGLRAYARYAGPLRTAIHRLKYHRDMALGETLSCFLIELYREVQWTIDLVVPVPLGVVRRKERGYNQAALIAYPFSLATRIRYDGRALRRVRETSSQVDLGLEQRFDNVQNAFWADAKRVSGKAVLIIDDVTTTGATLNACADALKKARASSVYGFVVARTFLSEGGKNDSASRSRESEYGGE